MLVLSGGVRHEPHFSQRTREMGHLLRLKNMLFAAWLLIPPPLARHLEQKNPRRHRHVDRVAIPTHGDTHRKIGRLKELLGKAELFAPNQKDGGKSAAQSFVVEQSGW
jgi:hypothetical protein